MWQDAFENGKDDLDEGTIIEVWKDWGHPGWKGMLKKVRNTDDLKKLAQFSLSTKHTSCSRHRKTKFPNYESPIFTTKFLF